MSLRSDVVVLILQYHQVQCWHHQEVVREAPVVHQKSQKVLLEPLHMLGNSSMLCRKRTSALTAKKYKQEKPPQWTVTLPIFMTTGGHVEAALPSVVMSSILVTIPYCGRDCRVDDIPDGHPCRTYPTFISFAMSLPHVNVYCRTFENQFKSIMMNNLCCFDTA